MKISNELVGKGGVGLVIFNLALRGIEFTETSKNSQHGDIWANFEGRGITKIEVKTATTDRWRINREQVNGVDLYALVNLPMAKVWIVDAIKIADVIAELPDAHPGKALLKISDLPGEAQGAWGVAISDFKDRKGYGARAGTKKPRSVRKKMADGTYKTYTYDRVAGKSSSP